MSNGAKAFYSEKAGFNVDLGTSTGERTARA
jgi:hypothetical protein